MNIRIKGDQVEIIGYVNSVERLSKLLTDRLGQFMERIKAGAFARALERAKDVRILLNHDYNMDLGGTADGNLELYEDAIGLHARAVINNKEVAEMARRGDLVGWSFGFTDKEVEMVDENGTTVRNVKDLNLYEVSLINRDKVPAYDGTLVAVRAEDTTINISDVTEIDAEIEEEPVEITEERAEDKPEAEEPQTENNHVADNGTFDYTKYRNIIKEMKGE